MVHAVKSLNVYTFELPKVDRDIVLSQTRHIHVSDGLAGVDLEDAMEAALNSKVHDLPQYHLPQNVLAEYGL